jgi:hypothetical protein
MATLEPIVGFVNRFVMDGHIVLLFGAVVGLIAVVSIHSCDLAINRAHYCHEHVFIVVWKATWFLSRNVIPAPVCWRAANDRCLRVAMS